MLAEEILPPSSPSFRESSNGDLVNLDDSTDASEYDVYEDFAVRKPGVVDEDYRFVDEHEPKFPTKNFRSYYCETRKCRIYLMEGETDGEFNGDAEDSASLEESFSVFDSSSEFESSIEEFEETEDGPSPKRPRISVPQDDTEKLLGDDGEEEVDDCLED